MFTDYLDLRTAVIDRVGSAERLAPVFDQLVKLAEIRLNRELRMADQITKLTLTISGGKGYLPSNLVEFIGIYTPSGRELVAGTDAQQEGSEQVFTVNSFYIEGPDGTYTLKYYAGLDSLSLSMSATNWLLETAPDVYFWALCEEASKWLKNVEEALLYARLRAEAIDALTGNDNRIRFGNARVRVRGVTP